MKIFTVNLADKMRNDETVDGKPMPSSPTSNSPPPIIAIPRKERGSFKRMFGCFTVFILAVLFALILCEIAYNRQRDEAYFRLKWAELQQRVLGYELAQAQQQQQQQPMIDERMAFTNRLTNADLAARERERERDQMTSTSGDRTVTDEAPLNPVDLRFAFLKALIEKMKERAQAAGLNGKMSVSVVELRRPLVMTSEENESPLRMLPPNSDSFQDGFGEVAAPSPFTQWMKNQEHRRFGPNSFSHSSNGFFGPSWERQRPWDRFPMSDRFPQGPFPRPWEESDEDSSSEMEQQQQQPQMRITHHFNDDNGAQPARVVTELFGDNAPNMLRNIMGQQQQQPQPVLPQAQPLIPQALEGSSWPRWEMEQPAWMLPTQQQQQQQFPPPPPLWMQAQQQQQQAQQMPMPGYPPSFYGQDTQQQPQQPSGGFAQPPASSDPTSGAQRDDTAWQFGQALGQNIASTFVDGQRAQGAPVPQPQSPSASSNNGVVDGANINVHSLPATNDVWYAPKNIDVRPAWAANVEPAATQSQDDADSGLMPHPSAVDPAPPTPDLSKTASDSSDASAPSRWRVNAWQHTQSDATSAEQPKSLLPERETSTNASPSSTETDSSASNAASAIANDDAQPSDHRLFQVDDPSDAMF